MIFVSTEWESYRSYLSSTFVSTERENASSSVVTLRVASRVSPICSPFSPTIATKSGFANFTVSSRGAMHSNDRSYRRHFPRTIAFTNFNPPASSTYDSCE
ncbi:hypothetical protein BC826DRAFT_1041776 [Russula brevipes]|nr:hypothetical protein BC826DRAFT_1041776 [Russula brevipes]